MITQLYIVIIFWSGLLIAWSLCVGVALGQIMLSLWKSGHTIRRTDISNFIVTTFTGIAFTTVMFAFSDWLTNLADAALIANMWYTVYLSFISYSNLAAWPGLCSGGSVRHSRTKETITP